MRKYLAVLVAYGWFFVAQTPWSDGKATITQVVGDFGSEAQCKAALDDVMDLYKQLGIPSRFKKCAYRQDV